MYTVAQAITRLLSRASIEITEDDASFMCVKHGLTAGNAYDPKNADQEKQIDLLLIDFIGWLLLSADVKEGSVSLTWDRKQVKAWRDELRAKWGIVIPDTTTKATVRDASSLW